MTTPTTPMTADDVLAVMKQGERMMPLGTSVRAAWIKSSAEARAAVAAVYDERDELLAVLREFQDGRRIRNPHTRQVARDIEQQALARSKGGAS